MEKTKLPAAVAALRVMQEWGVKRIYGLPAGSLNTWMDALYDEQEKMDFIQVRHEEVGALAASMQYKFSKNIGVCLGSGGPGATHLINGIYDAKHDNIPLLAIMGTRHEKELNMDAFQEFNQNPYYNDAAVYNRRVAYAEQLPKVIDEAIRTAITHKGPAVVEVPVNYGWEEIDGDSFYSSANAHRDYPNPVLDERDIDAAVAILEKAERPIIYAGIGTRGNGDAVVELSQKLKAPVAITGINYDTFHHDFEAQLGSAYRVARKTANEAIDEADTILFTGSNFPFSEVEGFFDHVDHFINIDIDPHKLGKRHEADVAILGDAGDALRAITEKISEKETNPWYLANLDNIKNWSEYTSYLEEKTDGHLQLYQVFHAINQVADEDAIYSIDVGNTTQTSGRHLKLTPKNMWRTSALFATMGNGLPGALAAKAEFPDRQVWNLCGDGAFSMVYPDIVTAVQYQLPKISVVFSNREYGFIKNAQEESNKNHYGVDFMDIDFAKVAEAQGAVGYTVREIHELESVFQQAVQDEKDGKVVVIDCKITDDRPMPVENLVLDPLWYDQEDIDAYKKRYEAENLKPFREFLEKHGLKSRHQ